jgi:hypothetical protein
MDYSCSGIQHSAEAFVGTVDTVGTGYKKITVYFISIVSTKYIPITIIVEYSAYRSAGRAVSMEGVRYLGMGDGVYRNPSQPTETNSNTRIVFMRDTSIVCSQRSFFTTTFIRIISSYIENVQIILIFVYGRMGMDY